MVLSGSPDMADAPKHLRRQEHGEARSVQTGRGHCRAERARHPAATLCPTLGLGHMDNSTRTRAH
eukprot:15473045-Alexandrium_andersonii.AAC.1